MDRGSKTMLQEATKTETNESLLLDLHGYQILARVNPLDLLKRAHESSQEPLDLQEHPRLSALALEPGGLLGLQRQVAFASGVAEREAFLPVWASVNCLGGFSYRQFSSRRIPELEQVEAELQQLEPQMSGYTRGLLQLGLYLTQGDGGAFLASLSG